MRTHVPRGVIRPVVKKKSRGVRAGQSGGQEMMSLTSVAAVELPRAAEDEALDEAAVASPSPCRPLPSCHPCVSSSSIVEHTATPTDGTASVAHPSIFPL